MLVGAGLASALIAQRLASAGADVEILMLEAGSAPFGEHTWSFHRTDVEVADLDWISPLIAHRWPKQSVSFQRHSRTLFTPYCALTSASVARALEAVPNLFIDADSPVESLAPNRVTLRGGESITAHCVIDARGYAQSDALVLGFQKFLGLEVETAQPHGLAEPVIMDATVDQKDGFRFVYLLPFSPTRLLIEDTRYSDGAALDVAALRKDIAAYAASRGWSVAQVLREEQGVLPIALAFDPVAFWTESPDEVPLVGMRAALFHPMTGYSLPEAVRVANLVAAHWEEGSAELSLRLCNHGLKRAREQRFYRFLARMLFRAAEPDKRHRVLERFYRLPQPLIERFYAGRTQKGDIARILFGWPPVPLGRALRCLREAPLLEEAKR